MGEEKVMDCIPGVGGEKGGGAKGGGEAPGITLGAAPVGRVGGTETSIASCLLIQGLHSYSLLTVNTTMVHRPRHFVRNKQPYQRIYPVAYIQIDKELI